ncbi:unnamed protein product [Gulo gulo]|uniref:Uncharacterized protein n=1 Tax=Gulo gulo TaxID=48420 RepID=A0A9X9LYC6_GULGU|nr:unnamed protein product [Gulo gulo]
MTQKYKIEEPNPNSNIDGNGGQQNQSAECTAKPSNVHKHSTVPCPQGHLSLPIPFVCFLLRLNV